MQAKTTENEVEEQEPEVSAASIFANYETADTFIITLAKGEKLICRMPKDASDVADIEKKALKLMKTVEKTPPVGWKPYLPITTEKARMICYLGLLERPKFSHLDGLKLAKTYAPVLLHIYNEIMEKVGSAIGQHEKDATDDFLDGSATI